MTVVANTNISGNVSGTYGFCYLISIQESRQVPANSTRRTHYYSVQNLVCSVIIQIHPTHQASKQHIELYTDNLYKTHNTHNTSDSRECDECGECDGCVSVIQDSWHLNKHPKLTLISIQGTSKLLNSWNTAIEMEKKVVMCFWIVYHT